MKLLIVGSKGFIGSHCVSYFAERNDVYGCDVAGTESGKNFFLIKEMGDFRALLSAGRFDAVINASGSPGVAFSYQDTARDFELNVANVRTMLEAIRDLSPSTKFLNFSSAAVYGNPSVLPVSEDSATAPLSPYGRHKLEAENMLGAFNRGHGLRVCSLRVFSAYGPGLRKQLFWDIYTKALNSKNILLFGSGKESRDFIFIGDLVRAVESVLGNADFGGESINIASGAETTIREAARVFLEQLGGGFELGFTGEEKEGDPLNWRADITRLKSLGFLPATDLRAGLSETSRSYQALAKTN